MLFAFIRASLLTRSLISSTFVQVYIPSPQVFLLRFSRAALRSHDEEFFKTCNFILDSHLIVSTHSCITPSLQAASATLLACLLYHQAKDHDAVHPRDVWTKTLEHFSNYQVQDLVPTSKEMAGQMILCSGGKSRSYLCLSIVLNFKIVFINTFP